MVIRCGDEFNMLEEGEASTETKRLKADLSAMIGQIEVGHRKSCVSFLR